MGVSKGGVTCVKMTRGTTGWNGRHIPSLSLSNYIYIQQSVYTEGERKGMMIKVGRKRGENIIIERERLCGRKRGVKVPCGGRARGDTSIPSRMDWRAALPISLIWIAHGNSWILNHGCVCVRAATRQFLFFFSFLDLYLPSFQNARDRWRSRNIHQKNVVFILFYSDSQIYFYRKENPKT